MIHPYKPCKSVVCIYDNKWVLLDGKTQVPRTSTLCTADVRYGISVNTSTNPYLQVDAFPKAYQASSITPGCQSAGREPDQILTMQRCLVGWCESRESTCLLPQTKPYAASSLPAFSLVWSKLGPMPVLAVAVIKQRWKKIKELHHLLVERQAHESRWRQASAGKVGNRARNKTSQLTYCLMELFVKLWVAISPMEGIYMDVR